MLRRYIILLSIFALLHPVERASAAPNWKAITAQDLRLTAADLGEPEADAAILFREGELDDNSPGGTSLKVYMRIKIFNDRGRRHAEVQLPYRVELGRITDVRARTVRPDGTAVEVEGRDIYDKLLAETSRGAWRAKVFSMPAVETGSIIEYRYRQTYPQGFRYFALDLQSELFTRELHYSIRPEARSRLDLRWVTFNARDPKQFAPTWDGTYDIRAENIPPFRREPLMPPESTVKMWGWVYYSEEKETRPDKYWRSYARRMHSGVGYETKPSGAIRRVVESITLSSESAQDKIARIYNYVQNEIRNVGFWDKQESGGAGDLGLKRNNSADDTIRRRYGTPREINRLFVSMLRAAGIDARVAELTTRDEAFFHKSFPDAFQFNSEVSAIVGRDGSVRFYDPGTPHCPLGMLSWEKEAVPALIYGKRDARFVETPITEAAHNNEDLSLRVIPSVDGSVNVEVESRSKGQRGIELRAELSSLTIDDQRGRIAAVVRRLPPGATIDESSVAVSNSADATAPLAVTYKFTLPQFVTRTERRLFLRPALLSHQDESLTTGLRRANSIYFHYPWSETERVVIESPEGYAVEQLPDPVSIDIGAASYQARFLRDGHRVIYERRLFVNAIVFAVDEYPAVKAFFDRVHQSDRTVVSFKQQ